VRPGRGRPALGPLRKAVRTLRSASPVTTARRPPELPQHYRPAPILRDRDAVGRERRLDPDRVREGASIVQRRTEGPPGRSASRSVDGGTEIRFGRFGSVAGEKGG